MGFYENAFRFMRDCYDELDRPEDHPMRRFEDAFKPDNYVGVTEKGLDGQWSNWSAYFPPAAGQPGDPFAVRNPFSVKGYLTQCLHLLRTLLLSVQDKGHLPSAEDGPASLTGAAASLITSLLSTVRSDLTGTAKRAARYGQLALGALILEAISVLQGLIDGVTRNGDAAKPAGLLDQLSGAIRYQFELLLATDPEVRRIWEIVDTVLAIIRGCLREGVLFSPQGFDLFG